MKTFGFLKPTSMRYTVSMILTFSGVIWYWRGPAPFYFVTVPEKESEVLSAISEEVTYGWGMIPVYVRIGETEWKTSLWPKDGGLGSGKNFNIMIY